jgi:hypothetical protein
MLVVTRNINIQNWSEIHECLFELRSSNNIGQVSYKNCRTTLWRVCIVYTVSSSDLQRGTRTRALNLSIRVAAIRSMR